MKTCRIVGCKQSCEPNRRYCRQHYLERKRQQAKIRFRNNGRYMYEGICCVCGKHFSAFRKRSVFCSWNCYAKYRSIAIDPNSVDDYYRVTSVYRRLATELLGDLGHNTVVHHIDGDRSNNTKGNLIVISRTTHVHLHIYLNMEKWKCAQCGMSSSEWKARIWKLTETWLKQWNKPYIRLDQIDERAQDLLKQMNLLKERSTVRG